MSDTEQAQQAEIEALKLQVEALRGGEPQSIRTISEPCEKHAKNPPGEQSWSDDGSRKRDPNGFDHACPDCQHRIVLEA